MPSVLFIENSQPFPRVLLGALIREGSLKIERAFSAVNGLNKVRERTYNLVLMCGRDAGRQKVVEAVRASGASFLAVELSPDRPVKDRRGSLQPATLRIDDLNNSTELTLSGYSGQQDLFAAASAHVLRYIREHFESRALDSRNLQVFSVLEGLQMGVAIISGRKLEKVNRHLADLLHLPPEAVPALELPDLFGSADEYREFSRAMSREKNEAGWHCSAHTLVARDGPGVPCTLMVRRLDGFDPLKGHLMIVERAGDGGPTLPDLRRAVTAGSVDDGRFEEIISRVTGIVITTDSEGTITHANATALAVFGYQPGEMVGRNLVGTIVPQGSRYARQMIAMVNDPVFCQDGCAIHAFENTKRNGEKVWVAWKMVALPGNGGSRVSGMLLMGEDITEHAAGAPNRIRADPWKYGLLEGTRVSEAVFDTVFHLCLEISYEGREGRAVGTSFVIGDTARVMEHSRPCTINSFEGQSKERRMITSPANAEVVKGLAQLDGAFVIREDGWIEASGRQFIIDDLPLEIPDGYGTRHAAVAGITRMTNAIGFVVSSSGGKISVMRNGRIHKSFVV